LSTAEDDRSRPSGHQGQDQLVLRERPVARRTAGLVHITASAVSGVVTFVRDGRLTDAGLRGSRVAELITTLAAIDQMSDEVRHLIRTSELEA
jgi:hypothetical protein